MTEPFGYQRPRELMPRLHVDFNSPDPFEVIGPGDKVVLFDGEGNECEARVREVRRAGHASTNFVIECEPDYATWRDPPDHDRERTER